MSQAESYTSQAETKTPLCSVWAPFHRNKQSWSMRRIDGVGLGVGVGVTTGGLVCGRLTSLGNTEFHFSK